MKKRRNYLIIVVLAAISMVLASCGLPIAERDSVSSVTMNTGVYATSGYVCDVREADESELPDNVLAELENYSTITKQYSYIKKASDQNDIYYVSLTEEEKPNFDQIAAQVTNDHPYAIIQSASTLDLDSIVRTAFSYIMSSDGIENYELCTQITVVYNYRDGNTHYVEFLRADCDETEFSRMLNECTANALKHTNQEDQLASIYSYIVENIAYDYDFSQENLMRNQSAGSVSRHKSVCAGISKFMQLCAKRVGISCTLITTQQHAFNYARLDDKYYLLDATWDLGQSRNNWNWFLIGSRTRDINDIQGQHTNYKDKYLDHVRIPDLSVDDYVETKDTSTPEPTTTPEPTESSTPEPTSTPDPEETEDPQPSSTPVPEENSTPEPTSTPDPEETEDPQPSSTPAPDETQEPQPSDVSHDNGVTEEVRITYMSVSRSSLCCKNDPIVDSSFIVEVGFSDGTTKTMGCQEYGQYYVVGSTDIDGGGEITYQVYYLDWCVECTLMVTDASPAETIYSFTVSYLSECHVGDSIAALVLSVEVTMADGSIKTIPSNEYTIEGGSTKTTGETCFTVKYQDKENNCSVLVLP